MRHFKKSGWRRESHTDGSLTKISLTQYQVLLQVKLHRNVNTFNVIMLNVKISMYQCLLFFSSYDGISAAFVLLFLFPIMPPATSQCTSLHNDMLPLSQLLISHTPKFTSWASDAGSLASSFFLPRWRQK